MPAQVSSAQGPGSPLGSRGGTSVSWPRKGEEGHRSLATGFWKVTGLGFVVSDQPGHELVSPSLLRSAARPEGT